MIGIAQSLWSDSVSREAVVAAAGNVRDQSAPPIATSTPTTPATAPPGNPVTTVSDAVQQAQSYHLPVGWGSGRWPPWSDVTNLATWLVGAVLTGPAPLGATGVPGTLEDQLGVLLGQRPQRASEPPEATPLPS